MPTLSEYLEEPQANPEERLEQREMLEDALQKLLVEMRRAIELCKSRGSACSPAVQARLQPRSRKRVYIAGDGRCWSA